MKEVKNKIHRILAPRLVVLVGSKSSDGHSNIIPISNITSVSVKPSMVVIAIYKPWTTTANLKTAKGFTISVPQKDQLELVWKLGQKYSGYNSDKDKIEEFGDELDLEFSEFGPVLKNSLGWVEYEIVDRPSEGEGDHMLFIGKVKKAMVNPKFYSDEVVPIGSPKPFMQWTSNTFAEPTDLFSIDFYNKPDFL